TEPLTVELRLGQLVADRKRFATRPAELVQLVEHVGRVRSAACPAAAGAVAIPHEERLAGDLERDLAAQAAALRDTGSRVHLRTLHGRRGELGRVLGV